MSNLAVKEFGTQANSYINISVEEYNAIIAENCRLQMELKQAAEELNRRKAVEEVAGVIMQQIKGIVTDSDTKPHREIQIPSFMNNRAAGGRR